MTPDDISRDSGMSRRYRIGFGPRRDKGFRFRPTIRDIGGSGRRADYQPRGDDEQPKTYDDVKVCKKNFDWLLVCVTNCKCIVHAVTHLNYGTLLSCC